MLGQTDRSLVFVSFARVVAAAAADDDDLRRRRWKDDDTDRHETLSSFIDLRFPFRAPCCLLRRNCAMRPNNDTVDTSVRGRWWRQQRPLRRRRRRRRRQSTGSGPRSKDAAGVATALFLLLLLNVVVAAANFNNYNAYNYDQNPMQFSPDGRLLQVEYASSAADWSPPLVVMECFDGSVVTATTTTRTTITTRTTTATDKVHQEDHDDEYGDQEISLPNSCLVLLTIPRQSAAMEALRNGGIDHGAADRDVPFLATPPPRPQQRILMLKNDNDDNDNNNNNINGGSSCCIGLSGVLADSLALLQMTMEEDTQRMIRQRSPWAVTQALANRCHSNTLGGGIRPFGSSLVVCGYDEQNYSYSATTKWDGVGTESIHRHAPCSFVYQTDPSGGIIRHVPHRQIDDDVRNDWAGRQGQNGDTISGFCRVRCIVGGSPTLQRQLHQRIAQAMTKLEEDRRQQQQQQQQRADPPPEAMALSLADRIATLSRVLIRETRKDDPPRSEKDSGKKIREGGDEAASALLSQLPPLEVVVISPKLGSHRLDTKQLQGIQDLILAQEKVEQDATKRRTYL